MRYAGLVTLLVAFAAQADPTALPAADVDHSVIVALQSRGIKQVKVISRIDLTKPFETASQWTLVVAQDMQPPPLEELASLEDHGPIAVCFVNLLVSDCSENLDGKVSSVNRWFDIPFEVLDSRVVHAGAADSVPMLLLKLCSERSGDGNCNQATALYRYDRLANRFYRVFLKSAARDQREPSRALS